MRKCCFDRILPADLLNKKPTSRGLAPIDSLWENGKTLKVYFLEGSPQQKAFVQSVAVQWSAYANIHFEFTEIQSESDIRITFDPNDGAWSTVGTDALQVWQTEPTMNLGWLDEAVVLHEFGHAIGLGHEHQNPIGGIQWDKETVYRELAGPPNYWTKEVVDNNLFNKYQEDQILASALDPLSIMMYPISENWTLNDFSIGFNPALSEQDKAFIGTVYPFDQPVVTPPIETPPIEEEEEPTPPSIPNLAVSKFYLYNGAINQPGEVQTLSFLVSQEARYIIETTGSTDLVMSLLGPSDPTNVLESDDDSGTDRNPQIKRVLTPGKYFLQVRHYDQTGTGSFRISIVTAESIDLEISNQMSDRPSRTV